MPEALGYRVLGIYAWIAVGWGVVTSLFLGIGMTGIALHDPGFGVVCALVLVAGISALGRGLPFLVRYGLLTSSLLGMIFVILDRTGPTPNWALLSLLVVTMSGMLFGIRGELGAGAILGAMYAGVAWHWFHHAPPLANPYLDFSNSSVWVRLFVVANIFIGGLLAVMHYTLLSLRESEEKFSKAFRSAPDAMAITEFDTGRIVEVNEGFERLMGYTRAEAVGRTTVELGFWPSEEQRARFVAQMIRDRSVQGYEVNRVTRAGEPITCLVNAERVTLGGRTCLVVTEQNITERLRAEAERARAVDREREAREEFTRRLMAAQEDERRRIAAELHDSLGQNLLLLKNHALRILNQPEAPAAVRAEVESIGELATQTIAEVRQMSHELRPHQLDQLGLRQALHVMLDAAAVSSGIRFDTRIEAIDDVLGAEAATHFYRIVQESVSNILKHSQAHAVKISIERDIRHIRLRIEDDGRGFEASAARRGLGLRNIGERARILGGKLQIDAAPDRGTRLDLEVETPES